MHRVRLSLVPPVRVPEWAQQLLLTRLELELRPETSLTLPADPDERLRGLLGSAIFDVVCARAHRSCEGCDILTHCEIPGWYDPGRPHAHAPRPVLPRSISPGGARIGPEEPWRAELLVLGAIPRPTLLVEAILRMARNGLGRARVPCKVALLLARGAGEAVTVLEEDAQVGGWPPPGTLASALHLPYRPEGVEIRVRSPLSWTGARPDRWPEAGDLLWAALGRVRQLLRAQGLPQPEPWPDPRALRTPWQEARWVEEDRRSSVVGRHDLSGWVGSLALGPEVEPWKDLLSAGELLGVGRSVSAGRGRLELRWR